MSLAARRRASRLLGAMCAAVAVVGFPCCAQALAGLPACEAKSPTIDTVTVKEVTMAGVTLEAQINPEGNETSYEFLIVWRALEPRERGEPLAIGSPVPEGHIGAGSSDVTVDALLSGLQPGYTYWYEVVATSLGNSTRSDATALPYFNSGWYDTGLVEGPPYAPPERAGCADESGNLAASETVREQRAKEAAAKEAAAAEEAALERRALERPGVVTPASRCTVPGMRGDALDVARRALDDAHCRLGRVRRPAHDHGGLVVVEQTPRRGMVLGSGALVTLVLGPAHARRSH
jgi:hypothetical protein